MTLAFVLPQVTNSGRQYWVDDLNPWALRITESIGIRWYGLAYVAGVVFIYLHLRYWSRAGILTLTRDDVPKLTFWMLVFGVLGGRLGDFLLYRPSEILHRPGMVFDPTISGMSVHGGIVSVVAMIVLFAKQHKLDGWLLSDALATASPLALAFGRAANFINGELWGRPSYVSWAVIFPHAPLENGVQVSRHPSQLYALVLEGILLYLLTLKVFRIQRVSGQTAGFACVGYGAFRFIDEFWRAPEVGQPIYFGWITSGQVLSLAMIFLGSFLLLMRSWVFKKHRAHPVVYGTRERY